jgi:hypothetical protein
MFGEDFIKEPYQKQANDDRIVRRKSYKVPFGWAKFPKNPNYIVPVPKELKALEIAIQYRDTGEYSWTELAAWLHKVTGRKISHMGFKYNYQKAKEKENGSTSSQETNIAKESEPPSISSSSESPASQST